MNQLELSQVEIEQLCGALLFQYFDLCKSEPTYAAELHELLVKLQTHRNSRSALPEQGRASLSLAERKPDDFISSPIPDGYYVDENNCLMPCSQADLFDDLPPIYRGVSHA